jgi:hypothetical protein
MIPRPARWRLAGSAALVSLLLFVPPGAAVQQIPDHTFSGATFGLARAPDGSLLIADSGAGIVEFRKGEGSLRVPLPAVSDMSPVGRGTMFAIGLIGDWGVYLVEDGTATQIADLLDFEAANNPGGETGPEAIDSNPFDVEAISASTALIADAGANALLEVRRSGAVDWLASFPEEVVSTAHIMALVGCPTPPPGFEFVCGLPASMPAQAVATSIAVGPDGAYYVGELKGFPAPVGESRIWRVEPGTRHADCGSSPACTIVADGFTSIVDLAFGPDGTLYVTELDENTWAAVEFGMGASGGTVNACNITTGSCSIAAGGLTIPMATTVGKDGTVYALTEALLPSAKVIILN